VAIFDHFPPGFMRIFLFFFAVKLPVVFGKFGAYRQVQWRSGAELRFGAGACQV
jgi:hypothetical protein